MEVLVGFSGVFANFRIHRAPVRI